MKNWNQEIISYIWGLSTEEQVALNNAYAFEDNVDAIFYSMDEFDEICDCFSPLEIANKIFYGDEFCPAHDYFWFNGCGNLESSNFPEIYEEDIADYCIRNDEDFSDDSIREILDKMNEEEEEE